MRTRQLSAFDQFLAGTGQALNVIAGNSHAKRPNPAKSEDNTLSEQDKKKSAGYMRVNHVGEVCAQALYQSQALTARSENTRHAMLQAASEEIDHLAWCEQRLHELSSRPSYLNPLWYSGSFAIGILAGFAGDRYNLGFLEETEKQVAEHLQSHLHKLPEQDLRSREIVEQMREDELHHAMMAHSSGAESMPEAVKTLMRITSKVMTRTAYYI